MTSEEVPDAQWEVWFLQRARVCGRARVRACVRGCVCVLQHVSAEIPTKKNEFLLGVGHDTVWRCICIPFHKH